MYDRANVIGTDKLSSIGEYISTIVVISVDNIAKYRLIPDDKSIIIDDDMKKAKDPSRVLLFILIVPYFLPNKAAKVSDIVIINNERTAIFRGKKKIIINEDRKT